MLDDSTAGVTRLSRLSHQERPGRAHRHILALAWGAWCTGFSSLMLLSFVLQPIQDAFGLAEGDLARLTAVGVGMTGAGGLLFGWMSDRLGRRASLAVSIAAFSLGNAACGLAPGFGWLIAARALAGLGIGGTWGGGQAMLGETFPPALRGRAGAVAQSGAPAGLGLAAILGSFVAPHLGWRAVFLLSAAPALVLLAWRRLPESDLWREHRRRLREGTLAALVVLRPLLLGALPDLGARRRHVGDHERHARHPALRPLVITAVAGRWGLAGGIALAAGFAFLAGAWVWTLPETAGSHLEI